MNNQENKKEITADIQPASQQAVGISEKPVKKDLLGTAKEFFSGALGTVKNRDLNQLVEEFTSEMTLVAEGLSDDQAKLHQTVNDVAAQQTIDREQIQEELKTLDERQTENTRQLEQLTKQLQQLQKAIADKKVKKVEGFTGLLRQATWLVGIAAGAWIIVTLLQYFLK